MIGWIIIGAIALAAVAVKTFWTNIKGWLNNTAADAVEKVLGYGARTRMHRAVSKIDRLMDKVRNRTIVYTKEQNDSTHFHKTTLIAEANPYDLDSDVLKEIKEKGEMVQEFGYKG